MHTTTRAVSLLLAAGLARAALADDFSWAAGNGLWTTPANWLPAGIPGTTDTARIGNLAGIQNSTVFLGADCGYGALELSDGMTLDMNNYEFVSFGVASLTGAGTRLIVRPHNGLNIHDFQGILHLAAGTTLDLRDNAPLRIFDDSWSNGTITGRGIVRIESIIPVPNDGVIRPGNNGGLTIDVLEGTGPLDPDGTSGNGHLQLDTPFSVLEIVASELADTFSGTITMAPGALLTMTLDSDWTADGAADLNITGNNTPASASQINGSDLVLNAHVNVGASQAHLRLLSSATVQSADVDIAPAAWLEFAGDTTVSGGQFTLGQAAKLEFDGPLTIDGGTFGTPSADLTDGFVAFNGPTEWRGNAQINGAASQNGAASVNLASTITADLYNLSGQSGNTAWNINAAFTLNAGSIGPGQAFTGSMTIATGIIGRLTLNSAPWTMAGTLTLVGTGPIYVNRLAGAPMTLTGDMTITNSRSEATADITALAGSSVNFAAPTTELRLRGHTAVHSGVAFTGSGQLINGVGGELTLYHGASLAQAGLLNQGTLLLRRSPTSDHPASATVDRFTNEGTLRARVGGHTPGDGYDYLKVLAGSAQLGGQLQVDVLDPFAPVPGDEFTILSAPGGVSGTFANDPVSHTLGRVYEWTVIYNPTNVVLHLDSVGTCYANCDNSTVAPILNVADFTCFINHFNAGDAYANCDGSSIPPILNVQDFSCFLNAFAAGCS